MLRFGSFYGPGTSLGIGGSVLEDIRQRRVPIVGKGTGYWSFIHIDDVAGATLAAVEGKAPGIYNIADDEPAPVAEWLPYLAGVLGAKPPRHIPAWLARLAIGPHGVAMMTVARGASNQKAKSTLPLKLKWPSWRQGFREALGDRSQQRDPAGRPARRLIASGFGYPNSTQERYFVAKPKSNKLGERNEIYENRLWHGGSVRMHFRCCRFIFCLPEESAMTPRRQSPILSSIMDFWCDASLADCVVLIARDPVRYRPIMPLAILEKFVCFGAGFPVVPDR